MTRLPGDRAAPGYNFSGIHLSVAGPEASSRAVVGFVVRDGVATPALIPVIPAPRATRCESCEESRPDTRMRDGTGEPGVPMCDECIAEFRANDVDGPQF